MPVVQVEGFGNIQFPDTMSQEEIVRAIETEIIPKGSAAREKGRGMQNAIRGKDDSFLSDIKAHAASAGLSALNGLTFGHGDEIIGAISGAVDPANFSQRYQEGRDYVRGANEQYKTNNPVAAGVTDVAGGMLTAPVAVLNAVGRGGALARTAATVGSGGAMGALSGAGNAETMAEVPMAAAQGAVLGAGTAGVLQGGGTILRGASDQIFPRFSGAAASELALRRLGYAMVRDETTGQRVLTRLEKLGPEAMIADAGGQNTLNQLDTLATLPGQTQNRVENAIRQRQTGRATRLDNIPNALGEGHQGGDIITHLTATQEATAAPLYAMVDRMKVPLTPTLMELTNRPAMKGAFAAAERTVANRGERFAENFDREMMQQGTMPLRFWDDVKKGLDDVISGVKRDPNNIQFGDVTSALNVKRELVRELDRLSTDPKTGQSVYREARDAFAGPAALKDAIEDGRRALTMKPAEVAETMFALSQSEKEAFRIGVADALRDRIGSRAGQANLLNAPFDRNTQMLLREVFGSERGYREAMATILREGQLRKLERVGRGSQTAGREARTEDMNAGVIEDSFNAAKGAATGNVGTMFSAGRSLAGRLGTPEAVRDELGRLLMQRGASAQDTLRAVDRVIREMQAGKSQAAAIQSVLGASILN